MNVQRRLAACSIAAAALVFGLGANAAGTAAQKPAPPRVVLKAGSFDPPAMAPELSVPSADGGTLKLADYRGKVVLLGFGFTSCPKVCPTTLAVLASARKQLGAQGRQVQVVYVTVDPERDDAQRMHTYLHGFDPTFVGGVGSVEQMAAVRQKYGVTAKKMPMGDSYVVGHSSSVYLIDRQGRLRAMMPYGRAPADYVHDVQALLAE